MSKPPPLSHDAVFAMQSVGNLSDRAIKRQSGIVSEPSSAMSQAKTKENVTSACQDAVKDERPALSFTDLIQEVVFS